MNPARRVTRALLLATLAFAPSLLFATAPAGAAVISNTPVDVPNAFTAVSCASATFCAAVDDVGNAFTYSETGNTWSPAFPLDPGIDLTSVSCTSSSSCMAGDLNGNTYTFNGTSWAAGATQPDGSAVMGVGCTPTPASCMVVTDNGSAFITNDDGSTWTSTPYLDGSSLNAVSCVSMAFCVVTDSLGNAFAYNGGTWTTSPVSLNPLTTVSCVAANDCVAIDSQGNVFTFDGLVWTAQPQNPVVTASGLSALTCPTTSLCVIGDANGDIFFDDGSAWSADPANPVDGGASLTALSCLSTTTCVGADDNGHVLIYAPPQPPSHPFSPLPQTPLEITSVNGTVGTPLTLGTSGGSGNGVVTFQLTSLGSAQCGLTSLGALTAVSAGSCTITATKASDGTYAAVTSSATQVTFVSAVTVPNPPTKKPPVRSHVLTRIVGPFANDSSVLTERLERSVDAIALVARRDGERRVFVTGFASAAGSQTQNEALSVARARVVAATLRAACTDRHFSVEVTAVGGGVGSAPTPAAERVVDVTLR